MESLVNGFEVSEVQDELVRLNLCIRGLTSSFAHCHSRGEMESINLNVRRQLELMRQNLEKLRVLAGKQTKSDAKKMLFADAESHANELTSCQKLFSDANLRCISELNRQVREELFSNGDSEADDLRKRQRTLRDKESLVSESGRATDHLAAISRQLADTVKRSAMTVEELAESSRMVNETHEEFKGMGAVLGHTRRLITKYGRREVTDRILIFFAALFFFACVFYVLRKRVLGPLDPFSLIWSTITTLISTLLSLVQ